MQDVTSGEQQQQRVAGAAGGGGVDVMEPGEGGGSARVSALCTGGLICPASSRELTSYSSSMMKGLCVRVLGGGEEGGRWCRGFETLSPTWMTALV